ncbi:hypothetical protein C8R46DRAFT_529657 [Mycena filopes]|nr:hypothetical protein C8R46DRAFT_529657 [Mycena filopes]
MSTDPVFPPELEREIFEITATLYLTSIPRLILVAQRVLTWIEPLLYTVVSVDQKSTKLIHSLLHKPPHFHNAVRHLSLRDNSRAKNGLEILALCPGIVNLAGTDGENGAFLAILDKLQIQQLACSLQDLFDPSPINLTHRAFSALTHLDMWMYGDRENEYEDILNLLPELPVLPALTHLALDSDIPRDDLLAVLARCPRLHVLLVTWSDADSTYETARFPHVYDVRFVIGTHADGDYWTEWEAGARGFPDNWSRATEFVARKRRGEIEATCYWLK